MTKDSEKKTRAVSAARLREARRNKGLSQETAALATGFSRRSFTAWESPTGTEPPPRHMRRLSELYDEPIWFLRGADLEDPNVGSRRHNL